jgi:hypothetical protein
MHLILKVVSILGTGELKPRWTKSKRKLKNEKGLAPVNCRPSSSVNHKIREIRVRFALIGCETSIHKPQR